MDLFGPLKTSESGKKYIMCITYAVLKFAELIALPDKQAPTVAEALFSRWFCRHGLPLEIVSDQGKEFCNEVVGDLLKRLKVKKTTTTPYHPQTNAQVEVVNNTIAQYLKTEVDTNRLNWEFYLAPMAFAYNTSFHRTISSTLFKVTYGLDNRTPDFEPKQLYGEDLPTELYQRMQAYHNMAKNLAMSSTDKAIDNYTKDHNKKLNSGTFKEGEKVLLKFKDFKLKNRKLCKEWKGPYIITKVYPNKTALIKAKFGRYEVMYNFDMLKH
jgi:transposase InsO family protein